MTYDYKKQQELEEARKHDERKKARKTIKKHNTGKYKRQAKKTIASAKPVKEMILTTPWEALSLIFQANISDWPYWAAFWAAVLKDLLDFAGIGSLPAIGTVITLCVSIFIGLMLILGSFGGSGKGEEQAGRVEQKIIRSWLVLLFGTGAEMLFGINFLPIETLTALILYGMVLAQRKQAKEKAREEKAREIQEQPQSIPTYAAADDYYEEDLQQAA